MKKTNTPPTLAVKNKRINTLTDLRRLLAEALNQLRRDEITEGKARVLGYLSSVMAAILKDAELEKRIEALEKALKK